LNLYRHIIVPGDGARVPFKSPLAMPHAKPQNRGEHGRRLAREMAKARETGLAWLAHYKWTGVLYGNGGFTIEIIASQFYPDVFESLSNGIEVSAVVPIPDKPWLHRVTLYIPAEAADLIEDRLARYLDEANDTKGGPAYADSIDRMTEIAFRDPLELVWTDPVALLPKRGANHWWEVWVRATRDDDFKHVLRTREIKQKSYYKYFPERVVRWVFTSAEVLEEIIANTGAIAELRQPYSIPSKILQASNSVQAELSRELLARTVAAPDTAPAVCILDTGVNHGHPLLAIASSGVESWTFNAAWGTHDGAVDGHGTQMAGLSLYGNIAPLLTQTDPIKLTHRVESFKVIPDDNAPDPDYDIESYGHVYHAGMLAPEVAFPNRARVYCSAVTSDMPSSLGYPSSWSGFIDEDCASQGKRRLFVISAGNLDRGGVLHAEDYPAANITAPIFDPAQAWNALTVGAYTNLTTIAEKRYAGYEPLAKAGGLCPQSRTTAFWESQWPIKPDIVLEGGNFARQPGDPTAHSIDDLAVLSTSHDPKTSAFSSFGCTSGAAAQAAHMCAAVAAQYPDLWPETIRALMVHSAEYTDEMLALYDANDGKKRRHLLALFGHGVPNKQKLLWSLQNDLTMIVQGKIQPFVARDGAVVSNEIVYYDLPWPVDVLQQHAEAPVTLRVTLSYFVEPNPSRRGFSGRYRYASHGLRFAVRRPGEGIQAFKERVNTLERDEEFQKQNGTDDGWFLKSKVRDRGCLISDSWEGGTAAELVDRGTIAIYPIGGWWKTLKDRRLAGREARFSLCVSLDVHDAQIDIYTPIQLAVENLVGVTADSGAAQV